MHVAVRLLTLAGENDPDVALAAALAVRAPRLGHVYADLATVRDTTVVDVEEPVDIASLPWPDVGAWIARLAASALVHDGPLRLEGTRVYLDRYWREERQIATDLRGFAGEAAGGCGDERAGGGAGAAVRAGRRRPARAPPTRRSGGGSPSSRAGPARARRRPSRGSPRCWPSRPRRPAPRRR